MEMRCAKWLSFHLSVSCPGYKELSSFTCSAVSQAVNIGLDCSCTSSLRSCDLEPFGKKLLFPWEVVWWDLALLSR